MRILLTMDAIDSPSEGWMGRMFDMIRPDVCAVAALAPEPCHWRGVPLIALNRWTRQLAVLFQRLGVSWASEWHARPLLRAIGQYGPDRILCNYATTAFVLRSLWERIALPVYVHCHGWDVTWEHPLIRRFYGRAYSDSLARLPGNVRFIANSKFTQDRMVAAGVDKNRIRLKYFGAAIEAGASRTRLHSRDVNILYLGRLIDFKGPIETIRAFECACDMGLRANLIIAGGGPLRRICDSHIARSRWSGRIRMSGWVTAEEGRRLRAESDIFTAHNCRGRTSKQEEAFGVSYIEAMAAGLPVVTGRSGGIGETVVDGRTGFLFEPGDIKKHAFYLLQLASEPSLRVQMGEAARAHVATSFSLDRERESLYEILRGNG